MASDESTIAEGIRKASGRAKLLIVLLAACVLSDVTGIATGWMQLALLNRAAAGEEIEEADADANDRLYGGVGFVQVGCFLATVVVWLLWLHAAYGNLVLGRRGPPRFTPGWAVGYWFIPFVNIVRPCQIVNELSCRSRDPDPSRPETTTDWVVGSWWAAWLISGVIGRIFFRQAGEAKEIDDYISMTWSGIINDGLTIVAGLLAIAVVHRITEGQRSWPEAGEAPALRP